MRSITEKKCNRCKETKPVSDFSWHKPNNGYSYICKKCHAEAKRNKYASTRVITSPTKSSLWRKENPSWERAKQKRKQPDVTELAMPTKSSRWRSLHPEYKNDAVASVNQRRLERKKENPDKYFAIVKAQKQRRRARKAGNGGGFTASEWIGLCSKYGNKCLCCGEEKNLTADHVIPLALGGTSDIDNIQPLCKSCNSRKGTKTIDYRKET